MADHVPAWLGQSVVLGGIGQFQFATDRFFYHSVSLDHLLYPGFAQIGVTQLQYISNGAYVHGFGYGDQAYTPRIAMCAIAGFGYVASDTLKPLCDCFVHTVYANDPPLEAILPR
jgi:hypothetical protein